MMISIKDKDIAKRVNEMVESLDMEGEVNFQIQTSLSAALSKMLLEYGAPEYLARFVGRLQLEKQATGNVTEDEEVLDRCLDILTRIASDKEEKDFEIFKDHYNRIFGELTLKKVEKGAFF